MRLLLDLLPVILFFASFKYAGRNVDEALDLLQFLSITGVSTEQAPILVATVVVIVATFAHIGLVRWRHGEVDKMLWVSLALVIVTGTLTLLFRDDSFIKWKPTLLYWTMGGGLLIALRVFGKNPLGSLLGSKIELPINIWHRLNLHWGGFFLVLGFTNLFVAFQFPTDVWVDFKLFGLTGLLLVFIVVQFLLLGPHLRQASAEFPQDR